VVARHEQNRDSWLGEALERRKCGFGEAGWHAASIQQVTAMDDHIALFEDAMVAW
jgi:hypothetical protein